MEKITRAITEEQVKNRRDEIINSCYEVYLEKGFFATSIKDISEKLTFARSSIYNYYQTKEEIFLDLLRNEYCDLYVDLNNINNIDNKISKKDLALLISQAISKKTALLQIISTALNELEKNSRIEFLIDFKKSYKCFIDTVCSLVEKYTELSQDKIEKFKELFFPFLFGLCTFTIVSEKQLEAMEKAGMNWISRTSQELCYDFIIEMIEK